MDRQDGSNKSVAGVASTPIEDVEFISAEALEHLTPQQQILFAEELQSEISALRNWAKDPERREGYADDSIAPRLRRILQVYEYIWETEGITLEISAEEANEFINALKKDEITQRNGQAYKENSKRKFANSLETHFTIRGVEWTSPTRFQDENPDLDSDPFTKNERKKIKQACYNLRSPPSYSNVTPQERENWNAKLAQDLGKPKSEIGPDDWEELKHNWKIPSLIHFAFDAASRAALVGRILTNHLELSSEKVAVPKDIAVKNTTDWEIGITTETTKLLRKWEKQRERKTKYDDSDHLWLNRKGNPYTSATLNNLLGNLIDDAGIEQGGRKLTWHSIRHSTGMYVYDETQDLGMVAEMLRLESLDAARIYAHPTPESQKNVLESIDRNP